MARIAFILHPQPGHLYPTFQLARVLRARGHDVHYIGTEDCDWVRAQGFEYHAVLRDVYPRGLRQALRAQRSSGHRRGIDDFRYRMSLGKRARSAMAEELPPLLQRARFDLVIVDSLLPYVASIAAPVTPARLMISAWMPSRFDTLAPPISSALVPTGGLGGRLGIRLANARVRLSAYERWTKRVAVNCVDRVRGRAREVPSIAVGRIPREPVIRGAFGATPASVQELILCPSAFDLPRADSSGLLYGDPSICLERAEEGTAALECLDARPLVYCSMGTQASAEQTGAFFSRVCDAFRHRKDLQVLIASGLSGASGTSQTIPDNVHVIGAAPQLAALKRASAFITHGGLGSIKEAIFFGVPMVVFPIRFDQPGNAVRVEWHGLGVCGNLRGSSARDIREKVCDVMSAGASYRRNIQQMQELFRSMQADQVSAAHVERLLQRRSRA